MKNRIIKGDMTWTKVIINNVLGDDSMIFPIRDIDVEAWEYYYKRGDNYYLRKDNEKIVVNNTNWFAKQKRGTIHIIHEITNGKKQLIYSKIKIGNNPQKN